MRGVNSVDADQMASTDIQCFQNRINQGFDSLIALFGENGYFNLLM